VTGQQVVVEVLDADVRSRRDLLTAGLDRCHGDHLVRRGNWQRLIPSVYATRPREVTDRELITAARAHLGEAFVVTGAAACRALGLTDIPEVAGIDVLVPPSVRRVGGNLIRVWPTTRHPRTWRRAGAAYADAARAVIDCGRWSPSLQTVRALVTGALCSRQCELAALVAELEAGARGGSALCRRALLDASRGARSAPEAEVSDVVLAAVRDGRLPPFWLNAELWLEGKLLGVADGYLKGLGLGWEVDSRRHHVGAPEFDHTLARHDAFLGAGLGLLHVTPRRARLLGPAYADVVVCAAQARQRLQPPEPAGLGVVPRGPLIGVDGRRARGGST